MSAKSGKVVANAEPWTGYGRLRDLNSQFQQFAVNAWCTPARVVAAHHPDQIPDLLRHAGPTSFATVDFPRPKQPEAFTMSSENCVGLDDHQDRFPVAPHAPQPDPEDSVGCRYFEPIGSRPPQDGELLPQGEVLQSQHRRGLQHRNDGAEYGEQDLPRRSKERIKVDQPQ